MYQSIYLNEALHSLNKDKWFIPINPYTRKINVPEFLRNIAVVNDNVSNKITFKVRRKFKDFDFNDYDCIICVTDAIGEYYEFDAIDVETDDEFITFNWLVTADVTDVEGNISVAIKFTKGDFVWQTLKARMHVMKGIVDSDIPIDPQNPDFIALKKKVEEMDKQMDNVAYISRIN